MKKKLLKMKQKKAAKMKKKKAAKLKKNSSETVKYLNSIDESDILFITNPLPLSMGQKTHFGEMLIKMK